MKYFCDTIPLPLAEKLKEIGMPIPVEFIPNYLGDPEGETISKIVPPSFAFVFDWLMEKGYRIVIKALPVNDPVLWYAYITTMAPDYDFVAYTIDYLSWHEAANAAIEKALELIK